MALFHAATQAGRLEFLTVTLTNKRCSGCKLTLPIANFYANKSTRDGFGGECKTCHDARAKTDSGKETRKRVARTQRAKHPEKERARTALRHAVRDGKITKEPCRYCGDLRSQGHHEDYSKPLDVIWVCDPCHKTIFHPKERENPNAVVS